MNTRTSSVGALTPTRGATTVHPLEFLFHPRSIAVVGALSDPRKQGYAYVDELKQFGFAGSIYPVGPQGGELLGCKVYASLRDIPGEIDYVISCVPAALAVSLMRDCVARGVKTVHLFTARLSETGDEDLRDLELQILEIARSAGIRMIGPNCMGLYYPREGLSFRYNLPREPGNVAFVSQSGGHGAELGYRGGLRGVRFSKIVSFGNASDLNESDFFEYFADDPETDVIAAYMEGTRDGRRFLRALKRATEKKPVIICKAGRTESGTRAASSHTGSMAGSDAVWDAVLRQHGVVRVSDLDEMVDVLLAFLRMRPPAGRNLGLLGAGGGGSVFAADACESQGLILPPLPVDVLEEIKSIAPQTWKLARNPLDTSAIGARETACLVFDLMARNDAFDFFIADGGMEWSLDRESWSDEIEPTQTSLMRSASDCGKPVAFAVRSPESNEQWRRDFCTRMHRAAVDAGFAVYPTVERAAHAAARLIGYHERRQRVMR